MGVFSTEINSNKMDNSLLTAGDINHKYIVVDIRFIFKVKIAVNIHL